MKTHSEYSKNWQNRKKELGLCVSCGKVEAKAGRLRCPACAKKLVDATRKCDAKKGRDKAWRKQYNRNYYLTNKEKIKQYQQRKRDEKTQDNGSRPTDVPSDGETS